MKCEWCDHPDITCSGEVKIIIAMTNYCFIGIKNSPEDPNRDLKLCKAHADDYRAYWREMWSDFYSQIL